MERFDRVTTMKVMSLRSQETMSGRKEFIVVGATSVCGEDFVCKGRVCLWCWWEEFGSCGRSLLWIGGDYYVWIEFVPTIARLPLFSKP